MTKEESLSITARIAREIAEHAPRISYSPGDLKNARATYSEEKLKELEEEGFYFGDFELFYCVKCFIDGMDLWQSADEEYLRKLFSQARKFDRAYFYDNPYLKQVKVRERRIKDILLTQGEYARGEFFQYDMPCLSYEIVVPKIGFFPQRVAFPVIYEGSIPRCCARLRQSFGFGAWPRVLSLSHFCKKGSGNNHHRGKKSRYHSPFSGGAASPISP